MREGRGVGVEWETLEYLDFVNFALGMVCTVDLFFTLATGSQVRHASL